MDTLQTIHGPKSFITSKVQHTHAKATMRRCNGDEPEHTSQNVISGGISYVETLTADAKEAHTHECRGGENKHDAEERHESNGQLWACEPEGCEVREGAQLQTEEKQQNNESPVIDVSRQRIAPVVGMVDLASAGF